jgi:hypothetical protein
VPGPIGRYGGISRRKIGGGVAAAALFVAVNVWALSAVGLLGGDADPQATRDLADDARTTPTPTVQSTRESIRRPSVVQTETPSGEATPTITERPRATVRRTEQTVEPTKTRHTRPPVKRPRPTYRWSIPPEYVERCKRENPEMAWWCDPKNWNR